MVILNILSIVLYFGQTFVSSDKFFLIGMNRQNAGIIKIVFFFS